MSKRVTTMEAFAAVAGVSRPTASKYFNDPDSVRPSTRERIERALAVHDYRPNFLAANLNRKSARILGVLMPHISDPFYTELVRTIEAEALAEGYFTIALSSHGDPEHEAYAIDCLLSMNVVGVVATPLGFASDLESFERLRQAVPMVLLDSRVAVDEAFIGTDNRSGIGQLVEYLVGAGEVPVYFDMPHVNANSRERRDAYREAMARAGLEPCVVADGVGYAGWDFERFAYRRAGALIEAGGLRSGAVVCANDRVAFGVLAAAYRHGLSVGRAPGSDLRVAGHDNQPLSEYSCPPLTTAAQDITAIGRSALRAVLARAGVASPADGEAPAVGDTIMPARLVRRESA